MGTNLAILSPIFLLYSGEVIIRALRAKKETLPQQILQVEIDASEKWMAESEVKHSSIIEVTEEAWDDLSRDIQILIEKLQEAGNKISAKLRK